VNKAIFWSRGKFNVSIAVIDARGLLSQSITDIDGVNAALPHAGSWGQTATILAIAKIFERDSGTPSSGGARRVLKIRTTKEEP
jgi:hypothetical protein